MKKLARRSALAAVAILATIGLVAAPAPSHARDTGWGYSAPVNGGGR